jgi:hypothetical protein
MRNLDLKAGLCGYLLLLALLFWASSGCTVVKFKDSILICDSPGAVASNVPDAEGAVAAGPGSSATSVTKPRSSVATGQGSEATDQREAGKKAGAAAVGKGTSATAPVTNGVHWGWMVGAALLVLALLALVGNKLVRGRWLW